MTRTSEYEIVFNMAIFLKWILLLNERIYRPNKGVDLALKLLELALGNLKKYLIYLTVSTGMLFHTFLMN